MICRVGLDTWQIAVHGQLGRRGPKRQAMAGSLLLGRLEPLAWTCWQTVEGSHGASSDMPCRQPVAGWLVLLPGSAWASRADRLLRLHSVAAELQKTRRLSCLHLTISISLPGCSAYDPAVHFPLGCASCTISPAAQTLVTLIMSPSMSCRALRKRSVSSCRKPVMSTA